MKTTLLKISGKCKYFRHIQPETFTLPNGKEDTRWKHVIYPDAPSLELIRDLQAEGVKNVLKKDGDGYYVSFGRKVEIEKKDKTKILLGNPKVTGPNGEDYSKTFIGDGSDITTTLEVYQHGTPGGGKAKAARWLATEVTHLVPVEQNSAEEPF
jgi:hypothetical protein